MSDDSYRTIFDSIDLALCVVELASDESARRDARIVDANRAFHEQSQDGDPVGESVRDIDTSHEDKWFDTYWDVIATGKPVHFQRQMPLLGNRWYDVYAFRVGSGERRRLGMLFNDITDRKHAEDALYESEAKFRAIAMQAQVSIVIFDADRRVVYVNDCLCRVLGRARHEIIGLRLNDVNGAEDWTKHEAEFGATLGAGQPFTLEMRTLAKDGSMCWTQLTVSARRDATGKIIGALAVGVDVTERRVVEEELRRAHDSLEQRVAERTRELAAEVNERRIAEDSVRSLIARVLSTQEDERRRIARELHDNLGQQLTALHLKLEMLRREGAGDESWQGRFRATQAYLHQFERDLDIFTSQLRPAGLYGLGLSNALTDFVSAWTSTSGITAELKLVGLEGVRLAANLEANLYRIAQEALNNVAKHAHAHHVAVVLQRRDAHVVLSVEDDGAGFDPDAVARTAASHMGLASIRERATLLGGVAQIESRRGGGTTVIVTAPAVYA